MIKNFMKAEDYNKGQKRINLRLSISDVELLCSQAEKKGLQTTSYVRMLVIEGIRKQQALYPIDTLPGQQNLFRKEKRKKK